MLLARQSLIPNQPGGGGHKDVLCSSSTFSYLVLSHCWTCLLLLLQYSCSSLHIGSHPTLSPQHLARMSDGFPWELEQESSAELLALLIAECFSRNHSPATFLKDAWRRVAFKARMGAVKFLYLHNSGSRSARIINEFWQEMGYDLNTLSLCHIQFLFLLPALHIQFHPRTCYRQNSLLFLQHCFIFCCEVDAVKLLAWMLFRSTTHSGIRQSSVTAPGERSRLSFERQDISICAGVCTRDCFKAV